MTIHAVIDTSALFGSRHRIDLQSLAQAGLFIAVWSPWIIGELNRVLTWQWVSAIRVRDISDESREACGQAARTMMALLQGIC